MELLQANVVDCLEYRILALAGEIDASVKTMLLSRVLGLLGDGETPLIIDMAGVEFCDSTGLSVAVRARRRAAESGCVLAFCGLNERLGKIFRVTGLDQFVSLYPTLTDAALALTGASRRG
jgi:anti-sigma B factor antagonist